MVVLGISPGTRSTGIAVLNESKLVRWQRLSFPKKWSKEKLHCILNAITSWIDLHKIETIAVKIPDELPISEAYIQLVGAINVLCENKNIRPTYYTLSEIKQRYDSKNKINKHCLVNFLLEYFPELQIHLQNADSRKKIYYEKVFEAVAAAHCFQNEV